MFKKILLATSGAPSTFGAARVAFDMAKRYGAEVLVFNVMGVPTKAFSQVVNDVRTGEEIEVDDEYKAWVEEELKSTFEKQIETVDFSRIILATGVPHREILRAARENDVDLIVMGASSGDSSVYRKGYPGSTLQRVAKAARCPVMTVHRETASYWGGFGNIVFATDFSKQAAHAFKFRPGLGQGAGLRPDHYSTPWTSAARCSTRTRSRTGSSQPGRASARPTTRATSRTWTSRSGKACPTWRSSKWPASGPPTSSSWRTTPTSWTRKRPASVQPWNR